MKERPILFSAPMVRAILEGRKTQTRRVVKPQPDAMHSGHPYWFVGGYRLSDTAHNPLRCPYGQPGDRLWVRETWAKTRIAQCPGLGEIFVYDACDNRTDYGGPWKPSIHMPRIASRILLEVVSVRAERLQEICEADCLAEGCAGGHGSIPGYNYSATSREHYRWLWKSINGPESWDANPLVWVVEFRKVQP